eukprot:scaffold434130_cov22-Prasinocladus_malaysianus.AAC.1
MFAKTTKNNVLSCSYSSLVLLFRASRSTYSRTVDDHSLSTDALPVAPTSDLAVRPESDGADQ